MKTVKTILLSMALVATTSSLHAQLTNKDFIYVINSSFNALTLTDIPDTSSGVLEVPAEGWYNYGMYPVERIASEAFKHNDDITKVIVPEGIKYIDRSAFYYCSKIESIELPYSLTTLSASFIGLESLRSLIIPPNVTSAKSPECLYMAGMVKGAYPSHLADPFRGMDCDCESVAYPGEGAVIEDGFIYNADRTALYYVPHDLKGEYEIPSTVTVVGDKAFSRCSNLTLIKIPESVTTIGNAAFRDCKSLTDIEIPENVTAIGDNAFEGCEKLQQVVLPADIRTIPANAFKNCKSLTSIVIPESVTSIAEGAFQDCAALQEIITASTVPASLDANAFNTDLDNITINVPLEAVRKYVSAPVWSEFPNYSTPSGDCIRHTEQKFNYLLLPDRTALLLYSNGYKNSLTGEVSIPDYVENADSQGVVSEYRLSTIMDGAMAGCTLLRGVTLPDNALLTEIGAGAFEECTSLTSINFPSTLVSIGDNAFFDSPITEIDLHEGIAEIGENAFGFTNSSHAPCTIDVLYLPKSLERIGADAFINRRFNRVSVDDIATLCSIEFGNREANPLYLAPYGLVVNGEEVIELVIPEGITDISSYALVSNVQRGFNKLTLPSTLETIGEYAFFNNQFVSVSIPQSVTDISFMAFSKVSGTKLSEFVIEDGDTPINIDADAFMYEYRGDKSYNAPKKLYIGRMLSEIPAGFAESVESLATGASLKEIDASQLSSLTSLKSLTLSKATTSIADGSFAGAKNLEEVVSQNQEPPVLAATGFADETYDNACLTVPVGSVKKYRDADNWQRFSMIRDTDGNEEDSDNTTGVGDIPAVDIKLSVADGLVVIENLPQGVLVTIFDESGRLIYSGKDATIEIGATAKGIYIVRIGSQSIKFMI